MSFSRHIHRYHSHADLIWPDGTFKEPQLLASKLGEKIEKRRGWKRSIEAARGGEDPLYT